MKNLILLLITLFLAFGVSGQSIVNGDFESWTSISFDNYTGWWNSNIMSMPMTGKASFIKTTDSHGGTYAAEMQSVSNGQDTFGGYIVNADPNVNSGGGGNNFAGGVPYAAKPSKITGYYKYSTPGTHKDSAAIFVLFKKSGVTLSQYLFKLGPASTYTAFSFNINLTATPDSMVFGAVSSFLMVGNQGNMNGIIPGSTLYLDDVAFTGTGTIPAIPGGNFETGWTNDSYNLPVGWILDGGGPGEVTRSTDNYNGEYAIQLKTIYQNSTARISNGKNSNNQNQGPTGGRPFSNKIDTLIGYYQYTSVGGDSGTVYVDFTKNGNQVGGYEIRLGSTSGDYNKFSIPINLSTTPDTMRIDIQNNNSYNGITHVGTSLLIDDIQLASAPLNAAINSYKWNSGIVNVYPNPASGNIVFQISNLAKSDDAISLTVYNDLGEVVATSIYPSFNNNINMDLSRFKRGMYYYKLKNGVSYLNGSFVKE